METLTEQSNQGLILCQHVSSTYKWNVPVNNVPILKKLWLLILSWPLSCWINLFDTPNSDYQPAVRLLDADLATNPHTDWQKLCFWSHLIWICTVCSKTRVKNIDFFFLYVVDYIQSRALCSSPCFSIYSFCHGMCSVLCCCGYILLL